EKIHLPPSYSIEKDYSEGALLTAKAASKGLGSVFRVFQEKGILIVAVQSQSFPGKIVVGVENIAHIFEEIQTKFWLLVGLLILSVISIFFLGLVTSSRIVTPITHVKRGLDAVAIGNFDVRVGIPRSDELGQLTQAFDQMIKELDRRKRLTTIVSETTLDAMAKHGDSDLQGGSLADRLTQGSRVSVIFLVSDIRNFTTLCESQPVKVITSLLNNHFDRMSEIIGAHGGRINKFIGDAINALFYLNENDRQETAKRAIETGLEMLNSLRKINLSRAQSGLFPYSIGVGLAMGEVIMGGLGDPRSPYFDHAVMGSPVKDASWLESLSKLVPHCPLVMCPKIARLAPWLGDKLVPLRDYDEKAVVFRHS
ncbi:adenylate/guanylate cyclase domain-containing protein, partial [bacterium]|nr:adenylate/guanylate cyclase domain-containing protein [bacterium]